MLSPSKPSDTSCGQGSPVGSLSAENALPDTWHQGHSATWPLWCVHAQSPCACLLPAQQCQDMEACVPCVGLTQLHTPTLWLVMLCCRTDFSGGQRYLLPVKTSVHENLDTTEALVVHVYGTHLHFLCTLICIWTPPCWMCVSQGGIFHGQQVAIFVPKLTSASYTFNCVFLSICNILLFSLFLDVSPVLLAVGDFIPELFISCFRLFVSTKKNSTLIHWFMHCLTGQNSLHLHVN